MRGTELPVEDQSAGYRYKHLKFLAALGAGTGFVLVPLFYVWDLPVLALYSLLYGTYCASAGWMVGRYQRLTDYLANAGVFFTVLITVGGILFQKPEVMVAHWVMTVPVVAYVLCHRKIAPLWVVLTVLGLLVVHQLQPHNLSWESVLMLAAALAAVSVGLNAFAKHIEQNEEMIVALSNTDSLTDTLNRRSFHHVLLSEYRRNLRQSCSMTVFMVDVDHFKSYNDHYGHVEGDTALVSIARVLKQATRRPGDFVFRYGGEEFCILCPGLDAEQTDMFAEQLRAMVEALGLAHEASPIKKLSVSIGYCHAGSLADRTPELLVEEADKALYRAKANGRNRVESYIGATSAPEV